MLIILTDKGDIRAAQATLEKTIRKEFRQRKISNIGYSGGMRRDVGIFSDGIYWCMSENHRSKETASPRRLNWFGKMLDKRDQEITVETNTTYAGRNDRIAGFFARDTETDTTYLLHSGKIGGGRKGVGRNAFLAWFNEELHIAADKDGDERSGVIVMPVEGEMAVQSLTRFIDNVSLFKQQVRAGTTETREFKKREAEYKDFYQEASGRRKGRRKSSFDYFSSHGLVVDALNEWREGKGLSASEKIKKNQLIDLGVFTNDELSELYEVKTSTDRQCLYSAIGQLIVHSADRKCRRTLVLPKVDRLPDDFQKALDMLGIERLSFAKKGKSFVIEG